MYLCLICVYLYDAFALLDILVVICYVLGSGGCCVVAFVLWVSILLGFVDLHYLLVSGLGCLCLVTFLRWVC